MKFLNITFKQSWGESIYLISYDSIKYVRTDIQPGYIVINFLDQIIQGYLDSDIYNEEVIMKSILNKTCDHFVVNESFDQIHEEEEENA